MTLTYKRLGATAVTANTDTLLYTVPASTSAVVSSVVVCNTGATARTFRLAICPGAIGSVTAADYIIYDAVVPGNNTYIATCGFSLAAASQVMVRAAHAEVVFNIWGSEVTA